MGYTQLSKLQGGFEPILIQNDKDEFLHRSYHAFCSSTLRLDILPRTTWAVCWSPR
jgi:hypothetical protein